MIEKTTSFARACISFMFDILIIACTIGATGLLIVLSAIDLKHWILPDELNFALALTGVVFHFAAAYLFFGIGGMFAGAALGAGLLYTIRHFANKYYEQDALGLGDVKLLGAAGFWLGVDGVLMAITLGALAGLIHGIGYAAWLRLRHKQNVSLSALAIPAGPGFAVGIFAVGAHMFHPFITETIHGLFS